jgi:uridine phosphorylase
MSNGTKRMMHIGLRKGDIADCVLLPGSPERSEAIAKKLDNVEEMAYFREFRTFTGFLEGKRISVCSTGIGGPSTAIAVEELYQCGARLLLRVGSCLATSNSVHRGDIIIPNGAVRMEGVTYHYEVPEFPAVPDLELVMELEAAAKRLQFPYHIGVSITRASYYSPLDPSSRPNAKHLQTSWDAYLKGGANSTDMDSGVLFVVGSCLGIRTASVLVSTTEGIPTLSQLEDCPQDLEERVMIIALSAMRSIIHEG